MPLHRLPEGDGGPYLAFAVFPEAAVTVAGETRSWADDFVHRHFCPTCGTHLNTYPRPAHVVIKVGTLDDPSAYPGPGAAIYMCDTQPFHQVAKDVTEFDKLPPRD